jgi:hypothetical protein
VNLREMAARHARDTLTRLDHLGEAVTYRAVGSPDQREIRVGVNRLDLESAAPGVRAVARLRAEIDIPRDSVTGCLSVSIGDQFTLPMRVGEEPRIARLKRIISQDEGMFLVEVEA